MKLLLKIAIVLTLVFSALNKLYFYINPSVTVINKSEHIILEVNIKLPESNLNFGTVERGGENSIYYELSQSDGNYQYSFKLGNTITEGKCGYLTKNEINKRFFLIINKSNFVSCKF
jgi:hypothetical protein